MIKRRHHARLMIGCAATAFLGAYPMDNAHADFPVVDFTSIIQAVRSFGLQVSQLATEIKTEIQTELNGLTEVKELAEDVQTVAHLGFMVENFIHYPNLGAAMGMMNMAGLNLSLPIDPYTVMGMMSGYSSMGSLSGIGSMAGSLSSMIPGTYDRDHVYSCADDSFSCAQAHQRANASAGYKGALGQLYTDTTTHNEVLNGLRTSLSGASDPKTVQDATGQAVVEQAWSTNQLTQVQLVNGLAQAQHWTQENQAEEKMRMDARDFLAAIPK